MRRVDESRERTKGPVEPGSSGARVTTGPKLLFPRDRTVERVDRRQAPRFLVILPVKLESGNGWARDASTSGVFFTTEQSFSPGTTGRFSLVLEHVDPHGPLHIGCEGEVMRVEPLGRNVGVAVRIRSYQVEAAEEQVPIRGQKGG